MRKKNASWYAKLFAEPGWDEEAHEKCYFTENEPSVMPLGCHYTDDHKLRAARLRLALLNGEVAWPPLLTQHPPGADTCYHGHRQLLHFPAAEELQLLRDDLYVTW